MQTDTHTSSGAKRLLLSAAAAGWLGCVQVVQAPPASVQPSAALPTQPQSTFGIVVEDAAGNPRFIPTDDVPNVEDQAYGWFVWVGSSASAIPWTERFTLPRAPDTWGDAASQPNVSISPDGRTAITQGASVPESGFIYNLWGVAPGDPPGRYEISVTLPSGRTERFSFNLSQPQESVSSVTPGTLADAVQACQRIQEAADIPITCEVDYIQGAPSMVVGFVDLDDASTYWEPMADHVASPFCDAANRANRLALVFVVVAQRAARPYVCELQKWGDWFELDSAEAIY